MKKSDPVSRYQSLQHEWKKSKFLKGGTQGRKLELDRFNKWRQLTDTANEKQAAKKGNVHRTLHKNQAMQERQPPVTHQSHRDEMRFTLRSKIANQNYVDKSMKNFHYQKHQP